MGTITKKQCVREINDNLKMDPEDVKGIVQEFLDTTAEYLINGDRIEIRNFGVFKIVTKKQHIGRNPKKPEKDIVIPERLAIKFIPGKQIKHLVKGIGE
jgi:nucleoid DNA-binding protein